MLSPEWRVIVDQAQTNNIMVGLSCCNQSGITELLIMKDSHHDRMYFKAVEILGALHF